MCTVRMMHSTTTVLLQQCMASMPVMKHAICSTLELTNEALYIIGQPYQQMCSFCVAVFPFKVYIICTLSLLLTTVFPALIITSSPSVLASLSQQCKHSTACSFCSFLPVIAVSHHGVDPSVINEAYEQNALLFDLPMEDKMALLADSNSRGYTPFRVSTPRPAYCYVQTHYAHF